MKVWAVYAISPHRYYFIILTLEMLRAAVSLGSGQVLNGMFHGVSQPSVWYLQDDICSGGSRTLCKMEAYNKKEGRGGILKMLNKENHNFCVPLGSRPRSIMESDLFNRE